MGESSFANIIFSFTTFLVDFSYKIMQNDDIIFSVSTIMCKMMVKSMDIKYLFKLNKTL